MENFKNLTVVFGGRQVAARLIGEVIVRWLHVEFRLQRLEDERTEDRFFANEFAQIAGMIERDTMYLATLLQMIEQPLQILIQALRVAINDTLEDFLYSH
jgi:hypothetical protein